MKRSYFGTDGVRGPYGGPVMNEQFAWRLGAAAARFAAASGASPSRRIYVGRDTRASGPALEQALVAGIAAAGYEPVCLGIVPTPAVSLAVRREGGALGAVITASHNPASDNGIKFFGPAGRKLTDEQEFQIEQQLPAQAVQDRRPAATAAFDAAACYLEALAGLLPAGSLRGWKVVLDTANGATARTSRAALARFGADVVQLGGEPDGTNINAGVGSEHPEQLCAWVKQHGARLGVAHDGDGDRCVLCDERGDVLDGDEILTILALHALKAGRLAKNTLVITVQSNLGVDAALAKAGGRTVRTSVGDRYVVEGMLAAGANLGGESSGHVVCADVSPTGDGLVAALKVIAVMVATGRPLSELRQALRKFPQKSAALVVREKKPLESLSAVTTAIAALEASLGTEGRVLVRYSGTEPKIRLLVEGPTDAAVADGLAALKAAVARDLELV